MTQRDVTCVFPPKGQVECYMSHSLSLHDVVGSRSQKRRRFSLHEDHNVELETKSATEGAR